VVAIDGVPAVEVKKRLVPFLAKENEYSWQAYVGLMQNAAALEAAGVVRSQERATLTLEKDGKSFALALDSRPMSDPKPEWAPLPFKTPLYLDRRGNYWFEYLPESGTLYINYSACREMPSPTFAQFARQVIDQAARQPPDTVVFDLRSNGGGNSGVWEPFLRAVRDTAALRPRGRTYVVVGLGTYSSGLLNALELKQEFHAIVVGEPTTERPNHYGDVRRFFLPNSCTEIWHSTKYFSRLPGDPPSLLPDLRAPLTAAHFFAGRDPVLEAIAKRITDRK
jgi:hypothetical protein